MFWSVFVAQRDREWPAAQRSSGYTLLELMTIVAILGITASIATPSYLGWANRQRLKAAQEQVHMVLHRARHRATKTLRPQQVSFRKQKNVVQWAIHPIDTQPTVWEKLPPQVQLDDETSLRFRQGTYIIQFNERGEVNGQLGRVTLSLPNEPRSKRCVMISTLLGAMRSGENRGKPRDGKYCY